MDIKENSKENISSFGDAFGTLRWKNEASLVEPGLENPWRDQTSVICRQSVPKRYD